MANNPSGHLLWACVFSFAILLPMSLPREISSLQIATLISFLCMMFVILVIVLECFLNKTVNPDLHDAVADAASKITTKPSVILNTFTIMIFSYMYQPNLP